MYRNGSVRLSGGYRTTYPQKDIIDEQPLSPSRRRTPLLPVIASTNDQPLSPTRRRSVGSPIFSAPIDEEAYESPIPSVKRASKSNSTEVFNDQSNGSTRIVSIKRAASPPPVQRTNGVTNGTAQVSNGAASQRRSYSPQRSRRSAELAANGMATGQMTNGAASQRRSTRQQSTNGIATGRKSNGSVTVSFEMSASDPNYQAIVELLRQCTTEDKCKMIKDHLSVGYDTEHTLDEAAAELRDLSIFSLLAQRTGLNNVLSQEKLTVFAPSNDAFRQLASTLGAARTDEQVASTLLSKLGTENVRSTLLNHVVPDIWNADYLSKISNVDLVTTSNQPLSVMPDNLGLSIAVGDKGAEVVEADIPASNGVIHVINSVI